MLAAVNGVVDFSKAQLQDVSWWRKSNVLIRTMARQREIEVMKAAHAFYCALISNGSLKEESFKEAQKEAKSIFNDMVNAYHPWATKSTEEVKGTEIKQLVDLYKQTMGDPSDPEYMARIKAGIAADDQKRKEKPKETEEARFDRVLKEIDEERARRTAATRRR